MREYKRDAYRDRFTIEAMQKYGGSFVQAIAKAFQVADAENYQELRDSFPHYWSKYEEMSEQDYQEDKLKP